MDKPRNEGQARELLLESGDGSLTAMRTPLADDPKDTPGVVIGRASHDLLNQAIEGCDASGCFAAAKDASTMKSGQPLPEEAFTPHPNDFATSVEAGGNLIIGKRPVNPFGA
jgi:hypothetical protein